MSHYILSVPAQEDLSGIFDHYFEQAGHRVSRKILSELVGAFRAIARNPGIGHERHDLAGDRSLLFWPVGSYLILYRTLGGSVEIVMIVHGSRDIPTLIHHRGL